MSNESDRSGGELKAFKICTHCDKEFLLEMSEINALEAGGLIANFQDCTHCGKRNDMWLRIVSPTPPTEAVVDKFCPNDECKLFNKDGIRDKCFACGYGEGTATGKQVLAEHEEKAT